MTPEEYARSFRLGEAHCECVPGRTCETHGALAGLIRAAVAEEREACAEIVERCYDLGLTEALGMGHGAEVPDEGKIADAIRERGD